MECYIAIEDWPDGPWVQLAYDCANACASVVPELANARLEVSILYTSNDTVHTLNREWRARDKPTNVLSFPMLTSNALQALAKDGPPVMLGDIALAHGICAQEAADKDAALAAHCAHLIVHGFFHLAGYDHEISERNAQEMEALEIKALAQLGISDPYNDRS